MRGEPESPETSCSGKERRSELESVGHRKRHSPRALSSEVSHVHLATPLPEQLFAERPAARAKAVISTENDRLRNLGLPELHAMNDQGQQLMGLLYSTFPMKETNLFLLNLLQVVRIHWRDSTAPIVLNVSKNQISLARETALLA
eukprot:COSAG06_NODE_189_length_20763_cov_8.677376_16_plen_145_part_00